MQRLTEEGKALECREDGAEEADVENKMGCEEDAEDKTVNQ